MKIEIQTVGKYGYRCKQNIEHGQIDGIIHWLSGETIKACKYKLSGETCQIFVKEILHQSSRSNVKPMSMYQKNPIKYSRTMIIQPKHVNCKASKLFSFT